MLKTLRKKLIVNEDGRIAINSPELRRGDSVEVIVLVNPEEDETEYLLSTEANRLHLREALQQLDNKKGYIYIDPEKL